MKPPLALADFREGFKLTSLWIALALEDIQDQHRRTALGPIWLILNYLVFVGAFTLVFANGAQNDKFTAYVAIGLLIFLYCQEVISTAITIFLREEAFIAGTRLPHSVYILKLTASSLFRFLYPLIACLVLLVTVGIPLTGLAKAMVGFAFLVMCTPAIILVLSYVGAIFPDSQFIVANMMKLLMFLTPIFWANGQGGMIDILYHINPITHFIELIRIPILYNEIPILSLTVCFAVTIILWNIGILTMGYFKYRLVFLL